MPKFTIRWNGGFAEISTVIEVENAGEALREAEAMARDQFDSNATWNAELVEEVAERVSTNGTSQVVGAE